MHLSLYILTFISFLLKKLLYIFSYIFLLIVSVLLLLIFNVKRLSLVEGPVLLNFLWAPPQTIQGNSDWIRSRFSNQNYICPIRVECAVTRYHRNEIACYIRSSYSQHYHARTGIPYSVKFSRCKIFADWCFQNFLRKQFLQIRDPVSIDTVF